MAAGRIIFFVLVVIVSMVCSKKQSVPTDEEYQDIIIACHKIYPIESSEIQDLIDSVHKEDADRLQKCYLKCFLEKTDMMDKNGNFNIQRIYDISYARHKNEMRQDPMNGIKECAKAYSDETNLCLKAFEATKCVADKKLWQRNEL